MILQFNVDEQTVTRTDSNTGLVNLSVDYLSLSFEFKEDSVWDSLEKKIEFYASGTGVYELELGNEDKVVVPFQVLTGDYFIFSLYGVDGDLRVTTNKMEVYLKESGFVGDGVTPSDDKRTVIQVINDRIDSVVVDVDALEATVSTHTGSISGLLNDVNGLGDSVDTLEDTVSRHTGSISDLTGTVNGHTNSINSLTGDVNRIDGTVTDLNGTVNDHSNMLSRHDGGISNLENDLASFREDYNQKINNTIEMTVEYLDGTIATFDVVVK